MGSQERSLIVDVREQQIEKCFQIILSDQSRMKKLRNEFRRGGYFNVKRFTFLPCKASNANSTPRRSNDGEQ